MEWFRMYSEFASDPKVQSMSEAMQRRLMMLLCLRCSNTLVTLQDDEIAFALRISDEELAETKAVFMRKGFVNEVWEIANWDKRQFVSDSSAPRVAAYRERQKQAKEQASNVTVTPQIQNRTDTEQKQNRTEKKAAQPPVALPDWLPLQNWGAYLEMRKEKKKVPTSRAVELVLAELSKLKSAGQDVAAVLDKSTRNGWTDVYAIKPELVTGRSSGSELAAINARNNAEAKRLLGIEDDMRVING